MIHQQPAYMPPPAAPVKNGLGTAALVLGIVAVVLSWVPFVGFVSYPLAVIGAILGLVGLGRLPRGTAVAGSIVSLAALVSVIAATVFYVGVLYAAANPDTSGSSIASGSSPSSQPSVLETHQAKRTQPKTAGIGEKVRDGSLQFTVLSVSHATRVGDSFLHQDAQGRYTVLEVRIKNVGDDAQTLLDDDQHVYDKRGRKFSADSTADIYASSGDNKSETWFAQLNPGNAVHGRIYFDLPAKAHATKVVFSAPDGGFDGVTVRLR